MKRNLLKVIEEKMPTFSKGQKRIAAYVIENSEDATLKNLVCGHR